MAAFVKSGSDALFTYMGVHGEYHKSFAGNLAGFNLFLLDTFRSLRNPARAHLAVETTIPGYTSNREVTEANEAAARKLERWMRKSHLMFTDLDVDFVFQGGADGELVIDGDPYWIAVQSRTGGAGRISDRFDDSATTLTANPAVFGSGYRLAKYAAFFRYLKADCAARWKTLQGEYRESQAGVGPLHHSHCGKCPTRFVDLRDRRSRGRQGRHQQRVKSWAGHGANAHRRRQAAARDRIRLWHPDRRRRLHVPAHRLVRDEVLDRRAADLATCHGA